ACHISLPAVRQRSSPWRPRGYRQLRAAARAPGAFRVDRPPAAGSRPLRGAPLSDVHWAWMCALTFLTAASWPGLHTGRLPTGSGWLVLLLAILLAALVRLLALVRGTRLLALVRAARSRGSHLRALPSRSCPAAHDRMHAH